MCKNLIYLFSFVLVPCIVLTNSANAELVGWWRFNEGSGDVCNDSSGNSHDGTVIGTPQWASGPEGFGPALVFNPEVCQGIDCGVFDPTNGTGQFSLALWAFWDGTGTYQHLLTKSNGWGNDTMMFQIELWGAHETDTYTDRIGVSYAPAGSIPFSVMPKNEWVYLAMTFDGSDLRLFVNGVDEEGPKPFSIGPDVDAPVYIGVSHPAEGRVFHGLLDEVRVYSHALSESEVLAAMQGSAGYPYALGPNPADGTLLTDTWATLGWSPGDFAVSHDVYIGDNFDDVNDGAESTFQGNQSEMLLVVGFPGYPYPDGLVPGTTYYWRIDEVNEAEPNSPWKGEVWSFMVPPKTAYYPDPANGADFVPLNATLTWTPGFGAKLHTIYFGEDFDTVNEAAGGAPIGLTSYTPGQLELAKTYYWRVDEFDAGITHKGNVWSFTTEGAVSGPNPSNGAVDVSPTQILSWDAGAIAASHEVYFGSDADAVKNATKASPEYKGAKALGEESYDPGKLMLNTAYYWRIDEINGVNPDSPWAGNVWSFTTGDFFVIDDFENYDSGDNQIWYAWHDGLGYGTPGTADFFAGNGTGAAVGDENTTSYTEETIVHGGGKSMPVLYDNNKQGYSNYSEVELALSAIRNWTEEGVTELSLWFYGDSANSVEPLYVAIASASGAFAVIVHDDPSAATISAWTQWVIPLQAFADQGINLSNVDKIAVGLGTRGNMTAPGGSGKMYFDDIRLNRP